MDSVDPNNLESFDKTYTLLQTLSLFPHLQESRSQMSLSEELLEELKKQTKPHIDLENTSMNEEIQKKLVLHYGNIVHLSCDMIVNSCHPLLCSGSGVNGEVWSRGGEDLQKKLGEIMKGRKDEPLEEGEYVVTSGYKLHPKKVIHILAPNVRTKEGVTKRKESILRDCYASCLEEFMKHSEEFQDDRSIAFVSLSTGKFAYPLIPSAHVACSTVRKWLEDDDNRRRVGKIVFCVKSKELSEIYENVMSLYFPK